MKNLLDDWEIALIVILVLVGLAIWGNYLTVKKAQPVTKTITTTQYIDKPVIKYVDKIVYIEKPVYYCPKVAH